MENTMLGAKVAMSGKAPEGVKASIAATPDVSAPLSECANYVGVDLGGTRLKLGVVDEHGVATCLENVPTPQSREEIYDAIASYARARCEELPIAGLGMSMPGIIDEMGYAVTAGAVKALRHHPVQSELADLLGLPVRVTNDGRSAALAEGWVGSAQGVRSYVVFTLGTAIGAGVVIEGRLLQGLGGLAGEFGMSLAEITDTDCEAHSYAQRAATVGGLCRQYSYAVHERVLDAREIRRRAREGDRVAERCLEEFYRAVAALILNTSVILAPELIVIGGGISASMEAMDAIRAHWDALVAGHPVLSTVEVPRLAVAGCRNEAGMVGAVRRLSM